MTYGKRLAALTAGTVLAAGMGIGFATSAFADPAGCTIPQPSIALSGTGLMTAHTQASCSAKATRTLRVEIKHDEAITPDVLVAANTQQANATAYSVSVSSCDNGNTATYYGRGFFTTNTTYHDSTHHSYHVC
jgi:hypothetical protein